MALLNLDALFRAYLRENYEGWDDIAEIEDDLPDIYMQWLGTPCEALHGVKPSQLFSGSTAEGLIDAFLNYHKAKLPVPDPLLDEIVDRPGCEEQLIAAVKGQIPAEQSARIEAIGLLNQMGAGNAVACCVDIVKCRGRDDALADMAMELLAGGGVGVRDKLLLALPDAAPDGADCILDLLSDMPPDERVFALLIEKFEQDKQQTAFCASLLQRYGDQRARKVLEEALSSGQVRRYLDFLALRDAIEAFGGEVDHSLADNLKDDPDYVKLNALPEE